MRAPPNAVTAQAEGDMRGSGRGDQTTCATGTRTRPVTSETNEAENAELSSKVEKMSLTIESRREWEEEVLRLERNGL